MSRGLGREIPGSEKLLLQANFGLIFCSPCQGRNNVNLKFGLDFPADVRTLMPECLGVEKFLPVTGPHENRFAGADVHDLRRRRPRSSAPKVCPPART